MLSSQFNAFETYIIDISTFELIALIKMDLIQAEFKLT